MNKLLLNNIVIPTWFGTDDYSRWFDPCPMTWDPLYYSFFYMIQIFSFMQCLRQKLWRSNYVKSCTCHNCAQLSGCVYFSGYVWFVLTQNKISGWKIATENSHSKRKCIILNTETPLITINIINHISTSPLPVITTELTSTRPLYTAYDVNWPLGFCHGSNGYSGVAIESRKKPLPRSLDCWEVLPRTETGFNSCNKAHSGCPGGRIMTSH